MPHLMSWVVLLFHHCEDCTVLLDPRPCVTMLVKNNEPIQEQSGNYTAKAKINKNANSEIRAALYIASLSASRYNKACAELYQRLRAKGKPRKQALIAVAHKLIVTTQEVGCSKV